MVINVSDIPIRKLLWVLPVAFAIHELEEWNILDWYFTDWTNVNPNQMTLITVRTWLVFISMVGFLHTFLGTRFRNDKVAVYFVFFFFGGFTFSHTFAHIYWLFDLGHYHPGVVSAIILIIPVTIYVALRSIRARLVSIWYLLAVFVLSVPPVVSGIQLDYHLPDDGLPFYRLSSWLVSLAA